MREIAPDELRALAADLEVELERLSKLEQEIQRVQLEIQRDPDRARLFYELQALKLHNFYTGCERIFSLIASELNGGMPSGFDWHKRLLHRMTVEYADRPPVLKVETAKQLEEFLAFRHVVRNVYGFELDVERVQRLVDRYVATWQNFDIDGRTFILWLLALAAQM
jgi:hypothetical protein